MKKMMMLTILFSLIALTLAPMAFARGGRGQGQGGHGMGGQGMGGRMGPPQFWNDSNVVEKLNLTQAQIDSLEDQDFGFREQKIAIHSEMQKLQLQLDRAFDADTINEAAILKLGDQINDAHAKMAKLGLQNRLGVRKILTAEQWDLLESNRPMRGRGNGQGAGGHGAGMNGNGRNCRF